MMKKSMRSTAVVLSLFLAAGLTGCGESKTYESYEIPEEKESILTPVGNTNVENPIIYEDAGVPDKEISSFSSDNGACVIKKMEHYYDITLDYESFTPAEVGKAYGEEITEVYPDYHEIIEPYIYSNIYTGFPALTDDFDPVWERVSMLAETIPEDYWEELDAFAKALSGDVHGYSEDGHISYEEAVTFCFIPEALRGTACSALSLWGEKTSTGDMITCRNLEWNLGTDFEMCKIHSVVHAKKGEKSYTGISFLGFESIVSAINNDGVFAAILDVGSMNEKYVYEDRKCYTYDLRYALEEFDTAKEVGDFMVANSANYTWSHNLIISDKDASYCAEDAVSQLQESGKGYSILRDNETPLLDGLSWDNLDSLCIVNSFASEGNQDGFVSQHNFARFNKYNDWVASQDKFTVGELKTALTQEKVAQGEEAGEAKVDNTRSTSTVQLIIVDYNTGRVQVSFTPETGPTDDVVFTDIGCY